MHGESAEWSIEAHLLAATVDALRWLQWVKTKDGQKGKNMPEPIERPGVESGKKRKTGTAMDIDEALDWLGKDFDKFRE